MHVLPGGLQESERRDVLDMKVGGIISQGQTHGVRNIHLPQALMEPAVFH